MFRRFWVGDFWLKRSHLSELGFRDHDYKAFKTLKPSILKLIYRCFSQIPCIERFVKEQELDIETVNFSKSPKITDDRKSSKLDVLN